jgi:hypothetical protein
LSIARLLSVLRVFLGAPQPAGEHLGSVYGKFKIGAYTDSMTISKDFFLPLWEETWAKNT